MPHTVERIALAPDLSISRVLTGLWQIADMERDGRALDPEPAARAIRAYVDAGFTTFDMADHYGSAEIVAGHLRQGADPAHPVQLFTKWVPKPGPLTPPTSARPSSAPCSGSDSPRSTCCSSTPGTMPIRAGSRRCCTCRR